MRVLQHAVAILNLHHRLSYVSKQLMTYFRVTFITCETTMTDLNDVRGLFLRQLNATLMTTHSANTHTY